MASWGELRRIEAHMPSLKTPRQELIEKGEKARQRTIAKATALKIAQQNKISKREATEQELIRKTAQTMRNIGKKAESLYRSLPAFTRMEVQILTDPYKRGLTGVMKGLDWVAKQTGRLWAGYKAGSEAVEEEIKKSPSKGSVSVKRYYAQPGLTPFSNPIFQKGFVKGFTKPEQAPKHVVTIKSKHLTPTENKILTGLVEGVLGNIFDPVNYVGIGAVSKARKAGEAAKGLEVALEAGEEAANLEKQITSLNKLGRVVKLNKQKAAKDLSVIKKDVTQAEKAIPKLASKVAKREEKLAELEESLKKISTVNTKRQKVEIQLQDAKKAYQDLFNSLPEQQELTRYTQEMNQLKDRIRVASIIGTPEKQQELAAKMQDLQNSITKITQKINSNKQLKQLSNKINKLTDSLNKMPVEAPAAVERKQKLADQIKNLQGELKSLSDELAKHRLTRAQAAKLQTEIKSADDFLKKIHTTKGETYSKLHKSQRTGEYAITIGGEPVASIEPLARKLRDFSRKATLALPESVRSKVNYGVTAFRPLTPLYREGMTAEEHMNLSRTLPQLHQEIRQAAMSGRLAGDEALRMWQEADIPQEARRQIIYYRDLTDEDKQAFLDKFDPEVRQQVLEADKVWEEDLNQITRRLEDAFGPQMHEFFGKSPLDVEDGFKFFIENYAPRIFRDPPKKIKSALETWAQRVGKQRVPGSKGFFTRERVDATLHELMALGLHPVDDPAIFSAAYRATAEQMIQLKKTTDWLMQYGYIRKGKAGADWGDGGVLFPWLKGYKVHPEVVRAFQTLKPLVELNADELKPLVKAWDYATNMFKGLVTSIRVGFHAVNTMGNIILMRMAGIPYTEVPSLLARAASVMAGKAAHSDEINRYFKLFGLEGQGMFADIVQTPTGLVHHFERQWEKMQGPLGKLKSVVWPKGTRLRELPFLLEPGRRLGEATDSVFRMATFLHFLDKGVSPSEAAGYVKRYLFDYSMLTPFERGMRRWVVPFYAWVRYAIPRSILATIEQPGTYTTYYRLQKAVADATGANLALLPAYNQTAFAVSDPNQPGTMIYVNPQPPWQQLLSWASGETDVGSEFARSWHPIWRMIPILTTGVDPLTGQKVEDVYPMLSPGMARLYHAVKTVTPLWEIEKLTDYEKNLTGKERVPVNERVVKGPAGYFTTPLNRYDWQADVAYKLQNEVEPKVDRLKKQMEVKEGIEIPEADKILQEKELQDKLAGPTRRVVKSMFDDPKKARIALLLAGGSPAVLQELLTKYPDFLEGTPKAVAYRMLELYTKDNFIKLRNYLGRNPKYIDFVRHKDQLMTNTLPVQSPVERLVEKEKGLIESAKAATTPNAPAASSRSTKNLSAADALEEAIRITGVDRESWLPLLQWLAQRESSGNPRAVNPKSVNGEHAAGLLQILPSTFRANALPGMTDITNPLHNAVAAIIYIKKTYGHPANIPNIGNWSAFKGY